MLSSVLPWVGGLAAILTSLSYIPQVRKALPRGSTDDLSLTMLAVLTSGPSAVDDLWGAEGGLDHHIGKWRRLHTHIDRVDL